MQSFLRHFSTAPALGIVGDVVHILADGAGTGGAYAVVHTICPPGGGPPPHTHTREDELFFVIEGELTFTVGETQLTAGPGSFVFAKRGERHTFHNAGDKPARFLITIVPAGLDAFFREVGTPMPTGCTTPIPPSPREVQKVMEGCPRYGITMHV